MSAWKSHLKNLSRWMSRLADSPEEPEDRPGSKSGAPVENKAIAPAKSNLSEQAELDRKNRTLGEQNKKLTMELQKASEALKDAKNSLEETKDALRQLGEPPNTYGTVLKVNKPKNSDTDKRWTADIYSGARKLRVGINPQLITKGKARPRPGQEVILNAESMCIVGVESEESSGEIVSLKEILEDKARAVVVGRGDEEKVLDLSEKLKKETLKSGDTLLANMRSNILLERLPRPEIEELILDETPDISYEDVAGLDSQIELIKDAVELPFIHQKLFNDYSLPTPKGILLYGPPGCGKTLIAKAVANSLAKQLKKSRNKNINSSFFNIKGPELLNKYVGETERQIRLIFQRAREKSRQGGPVIVFFDEMESLFRMRGSGISSDVESTIVPQLLAEIDGLEALRNVIVIGASNREDLIDPAILRPGRLDVKIKIERPNIDSALAIFSCYLRENLPISEKTIQENGGGEKGKALQYMVEETVAAMYATEEQNQFLEVTYLNGDKEIMYFKDFASGAMIENIVRRAKKLAIKRLINEESKSEEHGLCLEDLLFAVVQEFKEHEDLPNTTNPDDWARISGKKGERITFVRTLLKDNKSEEPFGGRSIEQLGTGQYL